MHILPSRILQRVDRCCFVLVAVHVILCLTDTIKVPTGEYTTQCKVKACCDSNKTCVLPPDLNLCRLGAIVSWTLLLMPIYLYIRRRCCARRHLSLHILPGRILLQFNRYF